MADIESTKTNIKKISDEIDSLAGLLPPGVDIGQEKKDIKAAEAVAEEAAKPGPLTPEKAAKTVREVGDGWQTYEAPDDWESQQEYVEEDIPDDVVDTGNGINNRDLKRGGIKEDEGPDMTAVAMRAFGVSDTDAETLVESYKGNSGNFAAFKEEVAGWNEDLAGRIKEGQFNTFEDVLYGTVNLENVKSESTPSGVKGISKEDIAKVRAETAANKASGKTRRTRASEQQAANAARNLESAEKRLQAVKLKAETNEIESYQKQLLKATNRVQDLLDNNKATISKIINGGTIDNPAEYSVYKNLIASIVDLGEKKDKSGNPIGEKFVKDIKVSGVPLYQIAVKAAEIAKSYQSKQGDPTEGFLSKLHSIAITRNQLEGFATSVMKITNFALERDAITVKDVYDDIYEGISGDVIHGDELMPHIEKICNAINKINEGGKRVEPRQVLEDIVPGLTVTMR